MSYKNDSEIVILNKLSKSSSHAKAELFETYDRLRDLTVSGPTLGGSGFGKFASFLTGLARTFGGSPFVPTLGSQSINIPGTSYFSPITGGTGIVPGGTSSFGLAPFSQISGLPSGAAAPIHTSVDPLAIFSSFGAGSQTANLNWSNGVGGVDFPLQEGLIGGLPPGGIVAGGASSIGTTAGNLGGVTAGTAAGAGFGRNLVLPTAGILSGIGGLLTTLGPFFGPFGLAAAAGGTILNGTAGAVLSSFQHVANRVLVNADVILTNKVKNLETTVRMLDAQQEIVKKLLKESLDGDRKALDNI